MIRQRLFWCNLSVGMALLAGCYHAPQPRPNPTIAPPLPVPAPMGPGQSPPASPPPVGQPNIPLPPGATPIPQGPPVGMPASPDQGRVQAISQRLYQANPWVQMKPRWIVQPGATPGVAPQGDQYVVISESLVHSASDGQLAAVMALQLGDLASIRQRTIADARRGQRRVSTPPDYYQQGNASEQTSSSIRDLELADYAKRRREPRDPRAREQHEQPIEPANYARQVLVQAGFSPQELDAAAPLLQRFPPVRPAR